MKIIRLLFLTFLFILSIIGYAQNNPDKEILVFFVDGVSQDVRTIQGQILKKPRLTKETLKQSLSSVGINESLMEVALPEFNKADTLKFLANGLKVEQPDMTKLYKIKVPEGKKRQDVIRYLNSLPEVLYAEQNGRVAPDVMPTDTRYDEQWGLKNTIYQGRDIHAEAVWDIYTGNSNNIIAIIDGGTQTTHVDLNDKISGGDTGFGWGGHGIHVSGIAAAESNNDQGISGVDWNARIHPQRIDNVTDDAATYQAIVDAVNYSPRVFVLNNSWGLLDGNGNPGRYSITIRQAFAYAYKANRTSVASMGNHQATLPGVINYPAGFANVIAVGATDYTDGIAYFSAQGNHIDVCAPGVGILSTIDGGYDYMSGTSMAVPHVSGIASLLKGYNPNLANDDIENIIKLSADDKGDSGFDVVYGSGRVNAERALNYLRAPYTLSQLSATSGSSVGSTGQLTMAFMGAPGLASANYLVKRYEVRKTVIFQNIFLHIDGVWGRGSSTTGWNLINPNFGEGFCEVVPGTLTNSEVTLRTYVYQVWNTAGSYLGYYPTSPSNVNFAYTVLGVPAPTLSGPSIVCTTGATFTLNNLLNGCTVSWTSSANLNPSSASGNPVTFTANGNGSGWVQPTITSTAYGSVTLPQKAVWVGVPVISYISGNQHAAAAQMDEIYYAEPYNALADASYSWQVSPSYYTLWSSGNEARISFPYDGDYWVTANAQNICGVTDAQLFVAVGIYEPYSIFPNPADDFFTITLTDNKVQEASSVSNAKTTFDLSSNATYSVNILNSMGMPVFSTKSAETSFSIPTSNLKDGSYIVVVGDGKKSFRKHLIVKH
ncbi:MAG: S8 family serine peptidase [Tenuifilaceae bacterium]